MTAATDITIKKNDGTTDIVWTLIAASGGDKSPAIWRSNSAAGTQGQRPTYQVAAKWNAAGDVRRVDISGSFPSVYTNSATGQTEVRSKMNMTASFAVPQNITTTDTFEFASQMAHLLNHALTIGAIQSGFAPT